MMRVEVVLEAWKANGLLPHQVIIWHKSRPVLDPLRLHVGLRAVHVRLARRAAADPSCGRRPTPRRSGRSISAGIEDGAGRHPPHA